ncbi:hypothetical protein SK128_006096 [Halocaridina rubra]|uniref:Uncharacterized protein n=1 Tax=Halocaridina rubra TaxID=373956 RepID=A0AAN8WVD1_HALRR
MDRTDSVTNGVSCMTTGAAAQCADYAAATDAHVRFLQGEYTYGNLELAKINFKTKTKKHTNGSWHQAHVWEVDSGVPQTEMWCSTIT